MAEKAATMSPLELDALVNQDLDLAFKVLTLDDEVDLIHREIYDRIKEVLGQTRICGICRRSRDLPAPRTGRRSFDQHCGEVIYLIEGEIVRHRSKQEALHAREPGTK